jgi:hypothetical protein
LAIAAAGFQIKLNHFSILPLGPTSSTGAGIARRRDFSFDRFEPFNVDESGLGQSRVMAVGRTTLRK